MKTYVLKDLTTAQLEEAVVFRHEPVDGAVWETLAQGKPTESERVLLRAITDKLLYYKTQRVNEATIWARAIYPLLMLAERGDIRAFAEVPLSGIVGEVELRGEADGALAASLEEELRTPLLVVVEAKRGVAGRDPLPQLLGAMLCAAQNNDHHGHPAGTIFGCYTIADVWTFIRATIGWEQPKPVLSLQSSREYMEKTEAATILAILQSIVGRYGQ